MVSDNPEGPYIDALGKPLLNEELTMGREYDPSVLIDYDGSAYICFGHYRPTDPDLRYFIAKLGEDMISLQETPKVVTINKFSGWSQDKPTRHKRNGIYYLSAGAFYGTAELLYFIRNKLSVYKHS